MMHRCSWPGCQLRVQSHLWGCRAHWYQLPAELRQRILRSFVQGQSVASWSPEYRSAFEAVQQWISQQGATP